MTIRSERVDTRAVLNGDYGWANGTSRAVRVRELQRVRDYWPEAMLRQIRDGIIQPPPWRLLVDPTAWHEIPAPEVAAYALYRLRERGRWPSIDGLRRRFGRVSNHRDGTENPRQEALL